jgi:hypothetical protein
MMDIPVGTVVTFQAPSERDAEGEKREIPAIVMKRWPDGSLQLFAFHFEGAHLVYTIPPDAVKIVKQPTVQADLKFSFANDVRQ